MRQNSTVSAKSADLKLRGKKTKLRITHFTKKVANGAQNEKFDHPVHKIEKLTSNLSFKEAMNSVLSLSEESGGGGGGGSRTGTSSTADLLKTRLLLLLRYSLPLTSKRRRVGD